MSSNNQYRMLNAINVIKYVLGLSILALLIHEILSGSTYAAKVNQLFQSSVIIKTLFSMGFYFFMFFKYRYSFQSIKLEHVKLVTLTFILGIGAFIYGLLDFVLVLLTPLCFEWADEFNRILILLFILALLVFFPLFIQYRPDPDFKSTSVTMISAGSMTLISCLFICGRIITQQVKQSMMIHNNRTTLLCNEKNVYKGFDSIVDTLKTLQMSCLMFYFLCGSFIYYVLMAMEKKIMDHLKLYEILDSSSIPSIVSNTSDSFSFNTSISNINRSNHEMNYLSFLKSNLFALIIGMLILLTLMVFTFLGSATYSGNDSEIHQNLNLLLEYGKIFIYIIMITISIFYWFVIAQWNIGRNTPSKIDNFSINAGTFGQVMSGLTVIASASYFIESNGRGNYFLILWIIASFLQITQCLLQRSIIHSITQRCIGQYIDPSNTNKSFWKTQLNPCVILCLSNLGLIITNFTKPEAMINSFILEENIAWVIVKHFTLPLEILNRIHGFTFMLDVTMIMRRRCAETVTKIDDDERLAIT